MDKKISEQQLTDMAKQLNDQFAGGEILPSEAVKGINGVNSLSEALGYKFRAKSSQEAERLYQQNQPRDIDEYEDEDEDGEGEYDDY